MQQFKGTYIFKQNNKEIGRSENLITTNGRKVLLQYLSGVKNEWAADMCIGALNTSVNVSDIELNFQFVGSRSQKTLIKISKLSDQYSFLLGKNILISINEELMDIIDEESIEILFDYVLNN